ncbi:MAG: biotin/lipoyl-binding protein [Caulobacterales bacterium]|nr:biotin/lipoyl-binding protein [Caulobacterales bacterium]
MEKGSEVTPFYDPMIAKLIAHAATREAAAEALAEACASVEVWPVKTNAAFLTRCANHPDFVSGDVDTGFIERRLEVLVASGDADLDVAAVGLFAENHYENEIVQGNDWPSPWDQVTGALGFRLNAAPRNVWALTVDGRKIVEQALSTQSQDSTWLVGSDADVRPARHEYLDPGHGAIHVGNRRFSYARIGDDLIMFDRGAAVAIAAPVFRGELDSASDGAVVSPMPGKVVSVSVSVGDTVTKGQTLLVLEAMKMEHALAAPFDGVVAELGAVAGGQVSEGVVLVKLEAAS